MGKGTPPWDDTSREHVARMRVDGLAEAACVAGDGACSRLGRVGCTGWCGVMLTSSVVD